MRKMVMKLDPDGIPRAYGIAPTEKVARAIAERQLALYRERKREVEDLLLAKCDYTERVEEVA